MRYTKEEKTELFRNILEHMGKGLSLTKALAATNDDFLLNMSSRTFYDWVEQDAEMAQSYARAREQMIDRKFESIEEDYSEEPQRDSESGRIDHGWVQLQKLKIDAKKWELAKLMPKKYGDRLAIDADVRTENKVNYDKLSDAALEEIINAANADDKPES